YDGDLAIEPTHGSHLTRTQAESPERPPSLESDRRASPASVGCPAEYPLPQALERERVAGHVLAQRALLLVYLPALGVDAIGDLERHRGNAVRVRVDEVARRNDDAVDRDAPADLEDVEGPVGRRHAEREEMEAEWADAIQIAHGAVGDEADGPEPHG